MPASTGIEAKQSTSATPKAGWLASGSTNTVCTARRRTTRRGRRRRRPGRALAGMQTHRASRGLPRRDEGGYTQLSTMSPPGAPNMRATENAAYAPTQAIARRAGAAGGLRLWE